MDAIELLLTRSSHAKLTEPAPTGDALETILNAGVRAPDHANLSPFRFVVCQNKGLDRLADIFTQATIKSGMEQVKVDKAQTMPYRAPMVIVAICEYKYHEKVPRVEQIATTACAVQNMQMAAFALGFNGIWRTGYLASNDYVRESFKLKQDDEILGFLYVGTPMTPTPIKRQKDSNTVTQMWD